jgi:hypothetical protein
MYLRNVGNIAHTHTVQQHKNKVNINNYPLRKPELNKKKVLRAWTGFRWPNIESTEGFHIWWTISEKAAKC